MSGAITTAEGTAAPAPGAPVLETRDLRAGYGAARILLGVTLSAAEGEVAALMGRNGAGKSTTLKAIIGLLRPSGGSVRFRGAEIAGRPPHEIARLGLGYVPEERRIFTDLTVAENLEVGRRPPRPGREPWTPERLFELFPNLAEMRARPAARISGGEQQMLAIARTLMGNPDAILLDEPSEGLAPVIVENMARSVRALKAEGMTVLLSEQNLFFARAVSDRAYVIESGEIRWHGTMEALFADEETRQAYLTV